MNGSRLRYVMLPVDKAIRFKIHHSIANLLSEVAKNGNSEKFDSEVGVFQAF